MKYRAQIIIEKEANSKEEFVRGLLSELQKICPDIGEATINKVAEETKEGGRSLFKWQYLED